MYESVFAGSSSSNMGTPQPTTPTDMAYGPAPDSAGSAGLASYFHPATGFGLAFWSGIAGIAALVIIYRSLPG
jgi:hypothetical protein